MNRISAVLAVRDEEEMIVGALETLKFVDEIIIVLDDRTTDSTKQLALKYTDKVYEKKFTTFSEFKNFGIRKSKNDWILILDADERIGRSLREEIMQAVDSTSHRAYRVPFRNYFYGSKIKHGHWNRENNIRLFANDRKLYYSGDIHEVLNISQGEEIGQLINPIAHFTHRSVIDNLHKTANYASIQAIEMLASVERVNSRKLFAVVFKEFYYRMISGRAYRDGVPGVVDALYQAFSIFCIYAHIWELQQSPSIKERYRRIEEKLND